MELHVYPYLKEKICDLDLYPTRNIIIAYKIRVSIHEP
jgi:hypothetical protein